MCRRTRPEDRSTDDAARGLGPAAPSREPSREESRSGSLRSFQDGSQTYRVGDRSGRWQITSIERDWQGIINIYADNRETPTRERQHFSVQDWRMQLATRGIVRSTEAMGDIAEAEARILYEITTIGGWGRALRIVGETSWAIFICYQNRREVERSIRRISRLNPALDWLQQHAPVTFQVILVQGLAARTGQRVPQPMNPNEIGREIGRIVRDLRTLALLVRDLARIIRGARSPAGILSSILAIAGRTGQGLFGSTLVQLLRAVSRMQRALRIPGRVVSRTSGAITQELRGRAADWARDNGITLNNEQIDQFIRENSDPETARKLTFVLTTIRDFINFSIRLSDALNFEMSNSRQIPSG